MAKLTDTQKRFIVQALACWDSPQEVADAVKVEFGLDVHRSQVAQYDPTKAAGQGLAKKWVELYWSTREGKIFPLACRKMRSSIRGNSLFLLLISVKI